MKQLTDWAREAGVRIEGSRPLDESKVQAPCIVRLPEGGFRLFYTGVGPAKPFEACQGYILSAVSQDGIKFEKEPGIRIAPRPDVPHSSLRALAPSIVRLDDGSWRAYFESRGPADLPTVIVSAVSTDLLHWEHEDGIRFSAFDGVAGPRVSRLQDGHLRLYCCASEFAGGDRSGTIIRQGVVSAVSNDGLSFEREPGFRILARQGEYDSSGITAAEPITPACAGETSLMVYSAWQDAPRGTVVPTHPSHDPNAVQSGLSADFAAASIAADIAGYRSRIFVAGSANGLDWDPVGCAIDGAGYDSDDIDGVHAEDMSVVRLDDGRLRMYYAACDRHGNWRIASAVTGS